MKRLGRLNYAILAGAVKMVGTFDYDQLDSLILESLKFEQVEEIKAFMKWVHTNGKTFGSGNYEEVFAEFKKSHSGSSFRLGRFETKKSQTDGQSISADVELVDKVMQDRGMWSHKREAWIRLKRIVQENILRESANNEHI